MFNSGALFPRFGERRKALRRRIYAFLFAYIRSERLMLKREKLIFFLDRFQPND